MIWVQHDFYSNFTGSKVTGDVTVSISIFKSEISDLIIYDFDNLIKLFEKCNIRVSRRWSDEEILDVIMSKIKTDEKFVKGLSYFFAKNNDVLKENSDKPWTVLLKTIGNEIKIIAQEFKRKPDVEKETRNSILKMLEVKSTKVPQRGRIVRKKDNTVLWIVGIAVVVVAGVLIYKWYKNNKLKQLGDGGSVEPMSDTINDLSSEGGAGDDYSNNPGFNVSPDVLKPDVPDAGVNPQAVAGQTVVTTTITPSGGALPNPGDVSGANQPVDSSLKPNQQPDGI